MTDITMYDDLPALNVKIRRWNPPTLPMTIDGEPTAPDFTEAWVEANVTEEQMAAAEQTASQQGFFGAEACARGLWGPDVDVWAEGRSGGWLVVRGLPDVEGWSPQLREEWEMFARDVAALVDRQEQRAYRFLYEHIFLTDPARQLSLARQAFDDADIDQDAIDDMVHELKAREASGINNGGTDAQLEYLISSLGLEEALSWIRNHNEDGI